MSTFLADMVKKGYTEDEVFGVLFESERERKRREMLTRVTKTVDAHRLKNIREFLAYQELATWRRAHGYDRDDSWMHGTRPLSPEEFTQSLWSEVNALTDATSMARQKVRNLINAIKQGKLSDEKYAILKRLVEKRDREAAQVTAVTRDDTVQHCSPISQTPEPPSVVYFNLENEERMELDELKSSSAGTGLKTPGQQCPPNQGIWEQGRITAFGILTMGAGSSKKGNISSSTRREKSTVTVAGISSTAATPENRRLKTFREQNKQFDPGGRREKAPPWNAAVLYFLFLRRSWEASCCFLFVLLLLLPCVCLFFRNYFFPQVITSQQAKRHGGRHGSSR